MRSRDQGALDAPILSHSTNQAGRSAPTRRVTEGPALANVSGTELTDGWVRPETYVPHWDPPQVPSVNRPGPFLLGRHHRISRVSAPTRRGLVFAAGRGLPRRKRSALAKRGL